MPELPEVETTLRGIAPHIEGKTVEAVVLRQLKLRWQINPDLGEILSGRQVLSCGRRAKYLLIRCAASRRILKGKRWKPWYCAN
nr:DNA-formamidopyrimidine glycosylase family protein [Neisseria meningitidis]